MIGAWFDYDLEHRRTWDFYPFRHTSFGDNCYSWVSWTLEVRWVAEQAGIEDKLLSPKSELGTSGK